MTAWFLAAVLFFAAFLFAGVRCAAGPIPLRVVGLQLASSVAALSFLALGELFREPTFTIVATVTALGSVPSNIAFVRYLERRL